MIPKIGDKVIFNNEWLDQLRVEYGTGSTSSYNVFSPLRGQILSIKNIGPDFVYFDETPVILWINVDGTAYNSGSGKLSKMFPLRLYNNEFVSNDNPDICKKCSSVGERFPMCCKCTNCGEIIWGI